MNRDDSQTPGRAVAVTGLSLINGLGAGATPVWDALERGRSAIAREAFSLPGGDEWDRHWLARSVEFDLAELGVDARTRAALIADRDDQILDPDLELLVAVAVMAVRDARLEWDPRANRVGLVTAIETPGVDYYVELVLQTAEDLRRTAMRGADAPALTDALGDLQNSRSLADRLYHQHRTAVYELHGFMHLHRIARALGLHGHAAHVNNACASGLYALENAVREIRCGGADAVIVAGAERPLLPTRHRWFHELGLLAEDGEVRPFDVERHGFVLGDGGAALVVEDLAAARARGAHIYAVYGGGAFNQDAWKITLPDPELALYGRALRGALDAAGIAPEEIDLLIPHGVATGLGDAYEARCLGRALGDHLASVPVLALKGAIGHNLGGSALSELAIGLLAMESGQVPPSPGCDRPDPALGVRAGAMVGARRIRHLLKGANGFAGFNAAVVLSSPDA